jgi:hypothetical protein
MAVVWLSFPPKPIAVSPSPVFVTLTVLADQDAEPDASAPVALVAQLMKSDDFGLDVALSVGARRDPGHDAKHGGHADCGEHHIPLHSNLHFKKVPRLKNYFPTDEPVVNCPDPGTGSARTTMWKAANVRMRTA